MKERRGKGMGHVGWGEEQVREEVGEGVGLRECQLVPRLCYQILHSPCP